MDRLKIHPRKKYSIKKVHNFICRACKVKKSSEELEIDHIIPASEGGTNEPSNLQPLCFDCHHDKTSKELDEYSEDKNSIINLSPKEKLKRLLDFLKENKGFSHPEIQFLVMNDPILSKFEYNSTILYTLFRKANNLNHRKSENVKYREQRDIIIFLLRKNLKLTYQELAELLSEYDFTISYVQIRNICVKFGDIEKEADRKGEKVDSKENKH